jgi:CheY-like chemotaxis protein
VTGAATNRLRRMRGYYRTHALGCEATRDSTVARLDPRVAAAFGQSLGTSALLRRFIGMGPRSSQILIVEDDLVVASELANVLTEQGLIVQGPVAEGIAALKLAEHNPPAVAIIDLNLAGEINGLTVARHLVEKFGVRVVFVSGHISEAIREGIDLTRHFISKPFTDEAVIGAVRELIDKIPAEPERGASAPTAQ